MSLLEFAANAVNDFRASADNMLSVLPVVKFRKPRNPGRVFSDFAAVAATVTFVAWTLPLAKKMDPGGAAIGTMLFSAVTYSVTRAVVRGVENVIARSFQRAAKGHHNG